MSYTLNYLYIILLVLISIFFIYKYKGKGIEERFAELNIQTINR